MTALNNIDDTSTRGIKLVYGERCYQDNNSLLKQYKIKQAVACSFLSFIEPVRARACVVCRMDRDNQLVAPRGLQYITK